MQWSSLISCTSGSSFCAGHACSTSWLGCTVHHSQQAGPRYVKAPTHALNKEEEKRPSMLDFKLWWCKSPLQVSVWFFRNSGRLVMKTTLWSSTAPITASPSPTAEPTYIARGRQSLCWCLLRSTGSDGETPARPTSVCWVRERWQLGWSWILFLVDTFCGIGLMHRLIDIVFLFNT